MSRVSDPSDVNPKAPAVFECREDVTCETCRGTFIAARGLKCEECDERGRQNCGNRTTVKQ